MNDLRTAAAILLVAVATVSRAAAEPDCQTIGELPAAAHGPRPNTVVAFGPGEKLTFSVQYGLITAGEATLEIHPDIKIRSDRPTYHIISQAASSPMFSTFFKVRDRVESFGPVPRGDDFVTLLAEQDHFVHVLFFIDIGWNHEHHRGRCHARRSAAPSRCRWSRASSCAGSRSAAARWWTSAASSAGGASVYSPNWMALSSRKRIAPSLLVSEITKRTRPWLEVSA